MRTLLAALAISLIPMAPALAAARVEVGLLSCEIEGGAGFIIGSSKQLSCTFDPGDGQPKEDYVGVVRKLGVDIGVTGKSYVKWAVLAPTLKAYRHGALAGDYVGGSAQATAGIGLGANALIGGSEKTFALQPVSVQAQSGLNVAAGLTTFELRSAE